MWHAGAPPGRVGGRNRTAGATRRVPEQRSAGYPPETRCDARCDQGHALAVPFVHHNNSANDSGATNDHCVIGDPSQFHTYAVQWTPQSLTFLYDGQTCLVDHWSSASPLIDPAPFNEPFYICLTQALGIGTNEFTPGTTPLPATTSVDWVRVWGLPSASG